MESEENMKQIDRISKMEKCYEESYEAIKKMLMALDEYEKIQKSYAQLADYYGSTLWMKDYEDDEAGKLPKDLKRGVLSEDLVYDLIQDNHEITTRLLKIITDNVKNYRY